jgi:type I restriction enzyme S subunit
MGKFTFVADSMLAHITANKSENLTLAAIRDTLLPKLMSGEIEVVNLSEIMFQRRV